MPNPALPYFEIWPVSLIEAKTEEGQRPLYETGGGPLGVEQAALSHLSSGGFQGIFSASEPWWQLAFILFWDQIYAPLEEGFDPQFGQPPTESQDIPLDLFSTSFYRRRREAIEGRAEQLQNQLLGEFIHEQVEARRASPCRIFRGATTDSAAAIYFLAERLQPALVVDICRHLLEDFRQNRRGLPDLVVVKQDVPHFVEVKSARDRLSAEQVEWFRFLSRHASVRGVVLAVNHSEAQLGRLRSHSTYQDGVIRIQFRRNSSRYLPEALRIAESASSHQIARDESGKEVHDVTLSRLATEAVRSLLSVVALWKGTRVWINESELDPLSCSPVLDCFLSKVEAGAGLCWCQSVHYTDFATTFSCNQVTLGNSAGGQLPWHQFGSLDSSSGAFTFDREKIRQEIVPKIHAASLCPVFDRGAAQTALDEVPERVLPGVDQGWGYMEQRGVVWMRVGGGWISGHGTRVFPGVPSMVGVFRHTSREVLEARRFQSALARDGIVMHIGAEMAMLEHESHQSPDASVPGNEGPPQTDRIAIAGDRKANGCLTLSLLGAVGVLLAVTILLARGGVGA